MDLKSFLLALLEFFDKVPRFEPVCTDSKYGGYNIIFPVKKIQYKVCNSKTIKGGLILECIINIFRINMLYQPVGRIKKIKVHFYTNYGIFNKIKCLYFFGLSQFRPLGQKSGEKL